MPYVLVLQALFEVTVLGPLIFHQMRLHLLLTPALFLQRHQLSPSLRRAVLPVRHFVEWWSALENMP